MRKSKAEKIDRSQETRRLSKIEIAELEWDELFKNSQDVLEKLADDANFDLKEVTPLHELGIIL